MKNENIIPIILVANNNFINQVAALITSIVDNSSQKNLLRFYILNSDITEQNKTLLKQHIYKYNKFHQINFVDMKKYTSNQMLQKYLNNDTYITPETYYRFYIIEMFNEYKKVLYLDCDMIVVDDIWKLYTINIDNYYAAVVEDFAVVNSFIKNRQEIYSKFTWKQYLEEKLHKKDKVCFNAGMLLLNLDSLRKNNIEQKLFDFLEKESPLQYQDQDVLNSVFDCKVKFIDEKFNLLQSRFTKEPVIVHYIGGNKPWNSYKANEYFELYWKYLKLTPYWNNQTLQLYNKLKSKYFVIKIFNFEIFKIRQDRRHYKIKFLFLGLTINKKWLFNFKSYE